MATLNSAGEIHLTPEERTLLAGIFEADQPKTATGCIMWAGVTREKTYADRDTGIEKMETRPADFTVYVDGRKKSMAPLRIAFAVANGYIPNGTLKWVKPKCGNALCVNPEHAQLTVPPAYYAKKMAMLNKGRQRQRPGPVTISLERQSQQPRSRETSLIAENEQLRQMLQKQQEQFATLLEKLNERL